MPTAILIDGAFFLRRFKESFPKLNPRDPNHIALGVTILSATHLARRLHADPKWMEITSNQYQPEESVELYRIFFYDCAPLTKRMHLPISRRSLNLGKSEEALTRTSIHDRLRQMRKVALRLGTLNEGLSGWKPKPESVKNWLANGKIFRPTDDDFQIDVVQKGVDMRLGLDIASMAFKKQVDQIILVAADADFIPATKLARREGIDVVLDPMHASVPRELMEHVDGIRQFRSEFQP